MKKLVLAISVLGCIAVNAESNKTPVWQDISQSQKSTISSVILAAKGKVKSRSFILDESLMKSRLGQLEANELFARRTTFEQSPIEISLPLPDGTYIDVKATPSQVISKKMSESNPDIKTWAISGVNNSRIVGVADFTSNGFSAMLMMPDGDTIFIDPDKDQSGDVYKSFSKNDNANSFNTPLNCAIHHDHTSHQAYPSFTARTGARDVTSFAANPNSRALDDSEFPNISTAGTKTYRLALSGTAEYTDSQGGTAGARSSMVTSVNRINPIFERDLGISLELVDAPDLIFSNSSTDPFSDPNNPNTLMRENGNYLSDQGLLDEMDIGHVISHTSNGGGSGVAFLEVACRGDVNTSNLGLIKGLKGAGASTSSNPSGATFDLVLLAHELGHQLGANHSFNSNLGNICISGRSPGVAVEPGSGSTIMSYSGLCGADNLINNPRDDNFHFASISQINSYTRSGAGAGCGTISTSGTVPTANAGNDLNIPANTPFLLDGTANGGTSSWDQIDIGTASAVDIDTGDNPIIRHIIPTSDQDRYIPSLANLFAGTNTKGEILPNSTRELNFAYVVRNNGVASDKKLINVTDTNSSFQVISQSSAETITTGQAIGVTWDTANTNAAPIGCNSVDIQLIRENGIKNMLLGSTANDGTQTLTVPASIPEMSNARMFVGCSDNSFFNISAGNITIEAGDITTPDPVPTDPVPTDPVPAEPVPAEPVPAEPVPAEPVPTEPVPTTPTEPSDDFGDGPSNDLSGNENSGGGGGGSFNYWLISMLALLGIRKSQPVRVRTKQSIRHRK